MRWAAFLVVLALAGGGRAQAPVAEDQARFERTLRRRHLPTAGPELLTFFRERTLTKEQITRLSAQVQQLGSPIYAQRVKAAAALVKAGQSAKPFLLEIIKSAAADPEVVRRAELCWRQIDDGDEAELALASAHLIARDHPEGAALVLVHYIAFATDPEIIEAVQLALNIVAAKAPKSEAALAAELRNDASRIRAAAGEALARAGALKNRTPVAHLLADSSPQVRLQVALALAEAKDESAIPVLIDVLAELPPERACRAEELLARLAGDDAPVLSLATKAAPSGRPPPAKKVRAAWREWWQEQDAGVDWHRLENPSQGYTLVTMMVPRGRLNGRIVEFTPGYQVHWKIEGTRYPLDAQVIGNDRVLIAEYFGNRVTERDFEGNIIWEKACTMPLSAQRFPSGETFIALLRGLLLLDRDGKELFTYFPSTGTIAAAQRARNGRMTVVLSGGELQVLDARGKEVRGFHVGQVLSRGSNFELLPGDHVLVPLYRENRIVEYDAEGRAVWEAPLPYPTTATRLPNGHTLAASALQQRLVEIDRAGKEVWSLELEGRPWRVRRR